MQGLLSDVPFIGILSLIHDMHHSGLLTVEAEVPFELRFTRGEVVGGGILDWQGLDAIHSCPLLSSQGSFTFSTSAPSSPNASAQALMPYDSFSTEWAKVSDEWQQSLQLLGSPSAILQGPMLPIFNQPAGCSVRAAAAFAGTSLADMAARAAEGVQAGRLAHTGRYAWFDVVLPPAAERYTPLSAQFDGASTLGQIIERGADSHLDRSLETGLNLEQVRSGMIDEIRLGLRFEGCGWVLRDLIWESSLSQPEGSSSP